MANAPVVRKSARLQDQGTEKSITSRRLPEVDEEGSIGNTSDEKDTEEEKQEEEDNVSSSANEEDESQDVEQDKLDVDAMAEAIEDLDRASDKLLEFILDGTDPEKHLEAKKQMDPKFVRNLSRRTKMLDLALDEFPRKPFIDVGEVSDAFGTDNYAPILYKANLAVMTMALFEFAEGTHSNVISLEILVDIFPEFFSGRSPEMEPELAVEVMTQCAIQSSVLGRRKGASALKYALSKISARTMSPSMEASKKFLRLCRERANMIRGLQAHPDELERRFRWSSFVVRMCRYIKNRLAEIESAASADDSDANFDLFEPAHLQYLKAQQTAIEQREGDGAQHAADAENFRNVPNLKHQAVVSTQHESDITSSAAGQQRKSNLFDAQADADHLSLDSQEYLEERQPKAGNSSPPKEKGKGKGRKRKRTVSSAEVDYGNGNVKDVNEFDELSDDANARAAHRITKRSTAREHGVLPPVDAELPGMDDEQIPAEASRPKLAPTQKQPRSLALSGNSANGASPARQTQALKRVGPTEEPAESKAPTETQRQSSEANTVFQTQAAQPFWYDEDIADRLEDRDAILQKWRKMDRPFKPQQRIPWSRSDELLLIHAIKLHRSRWTSIEKEFFTDFQYPDGTSSVRRNQVQLKDKARNLKTSFLKANLALPEGFENVTCKYTPPSQSSNELIQREG